MNVARLNFSHGTHSQHLETIALVRRLSSELGIPVAILGDLQGPRIRVGDIPGTINVCFLSQLLPQTPFPFRILVHATGP